MTIDDILASVDQPDLSSPEATALDAQLLIRLWVTERGVPELLPWPGALMERVMERVRKQVEKIEDLTAAASDPSTSKNPNTNLKLSILQTDLSRTQYVIRSLLRQRLSKLTKHSLHYLLLSSPPPSSSSPSSQSHHQQQSSQATFNTPTPTHPPSATNAYKSSTNASSAKQPLLSPQESAFLHTHQSLLTAHYNSSFLSTFPAQLRRLDDNAGGTSMIQGPETKEVVFVRCLVEEVRIVIPAGAGDEMGADEDIYGRRMRWGEVWVARWEGVKEAWRRGEVEVL
ncbi:GINS DNA replication complex subunit Sld5 [Histoplasma capsulatum]|uniref:DNA replication complex GINS protein SLD5 n=1 Tax=Ajellomyces capsulatus TaxID=5037 RepID=A0A8A1MI98_AJECA|nr:conserved hypothetical protein [Histoplasma mississippiense (nom. inval.)]EDN10096.1 conserved hypothetical protein [Histoplasma mississippiense (nom. inval.)]QSS66216.1 GINS DNA replication complex subunit Sld5 [Histoplasma capsulatum]